MYKQLGDQLRLRPFGQFKNLPEEQKVVATMQYSLLEVRYVIVPKAYLIILVFFLIAVGFGNRFGFKLYLWQKEQSNMSISIFPSTPQHGDAVFFSVTQERDVQ